MGILFRKKSDVKTFFSLLLLVILLGIVGGLYNIQMEKSGKNEDVLITNKYEEKIVYTTKTDLGIEKFRKHCKKEGGVFNECGSICALDSTVCAEICAYTCEFNSINNN